ncbi:glycosyl hydrolase 53 family protein [Candidatus Daviesbacteria bacterium]|nr:glycosyl hydrolase 53 family protein [Candidatus Daviesbacteria bacterium]
MLKLLDQKGAIPLLILIAGVGLIVFLIISATFSFRNQTFQTLFPKPSSKAATLYGPDNYGVNTGIALSEAAMPDVMAKEHAANIGWIRLLCNWDSIQASDPGPVPNPPTGLSNFKFNSCDANMTNVKNNSLQPLLGFYYASAWCNTGGVGLSQQEKSAPCDYNKFYDFVYHLVARYGYTEHSDLSLTKANGYAQGIVKYWEIGNEPDADSQLAPGGTAIEISNNYAHILQTAHDAIKAADPNAKILIGGLVIQSKADPTFFQDLLNNTTYPNTKNNFDIGNFHTYGIKTEAQSKMNEVRNDLAAVGVTKDTWVTENGYPSNLAQQNLLSDARLEANYGTDVQGQVNYMNDLRPYILKDLGAKKVFWYTSLDDPSDSTSFCSHGLFYYNGYQCNQAVLPSPAPVETAKPAFDTYKNIIAGTDTTLPTVSMSPLPQYVTGNVTLTANASDNIWVYKVEIYVDGIMQTDNSGNPDFYAPFTDSWPTGTLVQGSSHSIYAKAYDENFNMTQSAPITTVIQDTSNPTISINSPVGGSTVTGIVPISTTSSDNVGVTKVEFYLDSSTTPFATNSNPSPAPSPTTFNTTANWNSTTLPPDQQGIYHTIAVKAYDAYGNISLQPSVRVKLADTTKPTLSNLLPINGTIITVGIYATLQATATDNVRILNVTFSIDGTQQCSKGYSTAINDVYSCTNWKPTLHNHTYTISVTANDTASPANSTTQTFTLKTL